MRAKPVFGTTCLLMLAAGVGGSGQIQVKQSNVLDYGVVTAGTVLRACALIRNIGTLPLTFVPPPHGNCCGTCGLPTPERFVLQPGEGQLVRLPPLDTTYFRGPISKAIRIDCTPSPTIEVKLFACDRQVE
jgi:hypothetical protein